MKKRMMAAAAALCLAGGVAMAGQKYYNGVYISASQINGSMGDARNSGEPNSYLYVYFLGTASYTTMYVFARDAAGTSKYCWSSNPQLIAVMKGVTSDSYLFANFGANGECTQVGFETGSAFTPKTP